MKVERLMLLKNFGEKDLKRLVSLKNFGGSLP